MRKSRLTIASLVLAPTLVVAPVVPAKPAGVPTIARSLLSRMNSSSDGPITRRVSCAPTRTATLTFACELESVRSTHLRVDVAVTSGGLRETWHPLEG
jgi:hypothetical protein